MISRRGLFAGVGGLFLGRGMMPEQLVPDSMAATIADMQRRLQVLEATSRVGLNRSRFAWSTHAAGAAPVAVTSVFENGPAGSTWTDDRGTTGTGYPTVSLTTGRKVIILLSALQRNAYGGGTYLSSGGAVGLSIDGADPFSWIPNKPDMHVTVLNGTDATQFIRHALITGRANLTPGTHSFQVSTFWNVGGGATQPDLSSIFLAVIPID